MQISDTEFVMARAFDRTVDRNDRRSTAIIDDKNRTIGQLEAIVLGLQAELELERGRRRRAEFMLNRH